MLAQGLHLKGFFQFISHCITISVFLGVQIKVNRQLLVLSDIIRILVHHLAQNVLLVIIVPAPQPVYLLLVQKDTIALQRDSPSVTNVPEVCKNLI